MSISSSRRGLVGLGHDDGGRVGAEAVSRDCMAVPDHLASAVAGWLICYAQAGSAGRR
jgi:hypothetical protein